MRIEQKRKDRMFAVLSFVVIIVLILATTKFDAPKVLFNPKVVALGVGMMFGTLLRYFSKEDKRNSPNDSEDN